MKANQSVENYDSRIRECNYGDLNGKSSVLVKYEEHIDNPFPNGKQMLTIPEPM